MMHQTVMRFAPAALAMARFRPSVDVQHYRSVNALPQGRAGAEGIVRAKPQACRRHRGRRLGAITWIITLRLQELQARPFNDLTLTKACSDQAVYTDRSALAGGNAYDKNLPFQRYYAAHQALPRGLLSLQ